MEALDDTPKNLLRLQAKADEQGWWTWANRVEGRWRGKPVVSHGLKLHRDGVRIWCSWENGAFAGGLRQRPFGRLNSREITELVQS